MRTRRSSFSRTGRLLIEITEASISPRPQIFSRSHAGAGVNGLFITGKNHVRRRARVFVENSNKQEWSHAIWQALTTRSSYAARGEMRRDIIDSGYDCKIADYQK